MLSNKTSTLIIFLLFLLQAFLGKAQVPNIDLQIKKAKQEIEGIQYTGYITSFDLSKSEVQKIWWKYSKKLGILDNRKSHYLIKMPSSEKGLSSVSLLETATGDGESSTIFLAILDQTNNLFKEQVKQVLLEFKIKYYVELISEQVAIKEKALTAAGNSFNQYLTDSIKKGEKLSNPANTKLLNKIVKLTSELDQLKASFVKIQKATS